jgi:hypothetical protein
MRRLAIFIYLILISGITFVHGQSRGINRDKYHINISQTTDNITIDGLLDIQTVRKDTINAANYMVATIQRRIPGNSNISAFFINKQVIDAGDDSLFTGNRFNRIGGIEYNLYSSDNRWTGKAFYHQQFFEGAGFDDAVIAASIKYSSQYITAILNQAIVGAGYLAEIGGPKLLLNKKFYWNEVGATFMSDNCKLFNVILTSISGSSGASLLFQICSSSIPKTHSPLITVSKTAG